MSRRLEHAWPALAFLGLLAVVAFVWHHSLTSPRDFLVRDFRGRLACPPRNLIYKPQEPQLPVLATSNGTWALDFGPYAWDRSNSDMRQLFRTLSGRTVIVRGRWGVFRNSFIPDQPPRWIIRVVDIQPAPPGIPAPPAPPRPSRPVPRKPPGSWRFDRPTTAGPIAPL